MSFHHSIPELKAVVGNLARQYGAERGWLFGSYARGEAREGSDIDLRIDRGDIRGLQFAGLLGDLQDALNSKVDLISTAGMDERFRREIASEEILLYERKSS
ncbi:MAG: nucleotidyltransferase domain-containing protein [Oscillibacter sp.]|nr:nucleotidyltransferase domain-containing protein [Oscillibacter sp.]